jgi:hypothetical protein
MLVRRWSLVVGVLASSFLLACSTPTDPSASETGTSTSDGDSSGDGDGDSSGDGDGDGDDDSSGDGDGDGDPGCPVGAQDCPCTNGGICDPGLVCEAGLCIPASGDGEGDGDGDGDGDPVLDPFCDDYATQISACVPFGYQALYDACVQDLSDAEMIGPMCVAARQDLLTCNIWATCNPVSPDQCLPAMIEEMNACV